MITTVLTKTRLDVQAVHADNFISPAHARRHARAVLQHRADSQNRLRVEVPVVSQSLFRQELAAMAEHRPSFRPVVHGADQSLRLSLLSLFRQPLVSLRVVVLAISFITGRVLPATALMWGTMAPSAVWRRVLDFIIIDWVAVVGLAS